jgi:hypothetical protein
MIEASCVLPNLLRFYQHAFTAHTQAKGSEGPGATELRIPSMTGGTAILYLVS